MRIRDGDGGTAEWLLGENETRFRWKHGPVTINRRVENAGLKNSVLEAWYPRYNAVECVAFFEDDIEVLPYWYSFTLATMNKTILPVVDGAATSNNQSHFIFNPQTQTNNHHYPNQINQHHDRIKCESICIPSAYKQLEKMTL